MWFCCEEHTGVPTGVYYVPVEQCVLLSVLDDPGAVDIVQNMLCPNSVTLKTSSPNISQLSNLTILGHVMNSFYA